MLTHIQALNCDIKWIEHRIKLLKIRRSSALAAGTTSAWREANNISDSIRLLETRILYLDWQLKTYHTAV